MSIRDAWELYCSRWQIELLFQRWKSLGGIQVFIATHSLFLLRELHILQAKASARPDVRYFGLHRRDAGVEVLQGPDIADIGDVASLDEDLDQSDRYIDVETGAAFLSPPEEGGAPQ